MKPSRLLQRFASRLMQDPRSLKPIERFKSAVRGAVNPVILRTTMDRDYDLSRTLLVAGFPRSGTTWLAATLASIPGTGVLFEPLDLRRVRAARAAGLDGENFVAPGATWPAGEDFIRNLLRGQILTPWTTSHVPLRRALVLDRWIIKVVRANLMLGWIVSHFRIPPPVLLVRHPCAVYDSWVRRGWTIRQSAPGRDTGFFATYPELRDVLAYLRTPEEYFAAEWSMHHFAPLRQMTDDSYQLCFYEQLRSDGLGELRRILSRWGLQVPEDLKARLERPSAKASGRAQDRPHGWRARVPRDVANRIQHVVAAFGLKLYQES